MANNTVRTTAHPPTSTGDATESVPEVSGAVLASLADSLDRPEVVELIAGAVGPFARIYSEPYEELSPLRRWVRDAAAEADRSVPALASMAAVYGQLIASEDHSGPPLKLANGVNMIGLDDQGRRWLVPQVAKGVIHAMAETSDPKAVERALRKRGAVRFHWSVERTFLVPAPGEIADLLPLPPAGRYLLAYQGTQRIVTKPKFRKAATRLAGHHPVADILVWDTTQETPVLASVRGGLAHRAGRDTGWDDDVAEAVKSLSASMWP